MQIKIGTAGWAIPRQIRDLFPVKGSSLERYADRLSVTEINSSFHRPHRLSTWERWREAVPASFRFAVKVPKTITHTAQLRDCSNLIDEFLVQASVLQDALEVLLVQLPPKLEFKATLARTFFGQLNSRSPAKIACEPRNASWFTPAATALLTDLKVARVAADPAICAAAAVPGGWNGLRYWRLHGSPTVYRSSYSDRIRLYAERIREFAAPGVPTWCIFDNTASSAALSDALRLADHIQKGCSPD